MIAVGWDGNRLPLSLSPVLHGIAHFGVDQRINIRVDDLVDTERRCRGLRTQENNRNSTRTTGRCPNVLNNLTGSFLNLIGS